MSSGHGKHADVDQRTLDAIRLIARGANGRENQLSAIRKLGEVGDITGLHDLVLYPGLNSAEGAPQELALDELAKLGDKETVRNIAKLPALSSRRLQLKAIDYLSTMGDLETLMQIVRYPAAYGDEAAAHAAKKLAQSTLGLKESERPASKDVESTHGRTELPSLEFDAFICHASEDKKEIAEPLAKMFIAKNLKVWYDEFTLTVGDSLRQKIDYGLDSLMSALLHYVLQGFFADSW